MEEAQEKDMDSIASFKSGKTLPITGRQYNICSQNQMLNLLVSSNRYGYIFYATEIDGLAIIPSSYIDQESRYLSVTSEDDDDDNNTDENQQLGKTPIIYRSYLPDQKLNKNPSFIPYWLSLNSDETILAIILCKLDTHSCLIILYDVVKLIQTSDSTPICSPMSLSKDVIGGTIQNFQWNPAIPNIFAYIDGLGSVSTFEIDINSKQLKVLGRSDANDDYSSICWSPKGKQIVLVTYDGTLELYEPNMRLKKKYPSATINASFPPCISVLWLSTPQFLLGFSENSPDENGNDNSFFHVCVTYDKDQTPKAQIYNDLFFDTAEALMDINPQYYYVRLNESKIIICGLSKSLKINVIGQNELNQDSLDIWSFADQFRATVKGSTNTNNERPILTGMALGLNSTLSISEGNKKLSSCPVLLLSNSEGLLQVYYFIHKSLPSICRSPEVIKQIQPNNILGAPSLTLTSLESFIPPQSSTNGFSLPKTSSILTPTTTAQPKDSSISNVFNFNQQQPTNGSSFNDLSKVIGMNISDKSTPVQPRQTKSTINNEQSSPSIVDNKKLLQTIDEFQSKLKSLQKPLSQPSELSTNLDTSLENLTKTLNDMTTSVQTSIQLMKTMTSEHIESMTKIENARHQIKLSQKENLYHLLKDRELDPWTQSRLDSIQTKYNQLKHDLNVLLQLTHTTIHDKSLTTDNDQTENEDFLPDLEISLNTNETMKHRIQKRIRELSHKVSETENDLQIICSKLNTDLLSSKIFDTTFNKTTMSSNRPFHSLDAQILAHLQATRSKIAEIHVPPAAIINLSSSTIEQKKQSTIEISKPITPSIQPSTPKQPNSPSVDPESFKNMLRIVRTSIDLFSGVTSPEQLQELSNTIATSPLSATQKSNTTPINKTPTIPKIASLSKTSTITKPLTTTNLSQTPAKSVTSPLPTISVTPATPATQLLTSDATLKIQPTKPLVQTASDPSKSSSLGDTAIRSLLTDTVSLQTTKPSILSQPVITSTPNQAATSIPFGNLPGTLAAQVVSQSASPTTTPVISTQSTSPTTRPIMSTGSSSFGSKPAFGGVPLNLSSPSSTIPFSNTATATTTSAPSPFSGAFGASGSTATNSVPSTSPFGTATSLTPSPFGIGFGNVTTTATTSAPTTGTFGTPTTSTTSSFGSGFGGGAPAATTSAPTTSIFGAATTSTSSPFSGGFGTTTTASTSSPFSGGFATTTTASTTSAPSPGSFGSGFGANASATSPFGGSFTTQTSPSSPSIFGGAFGATSSAPSGSVFGGFGANSTAPTSTSVSSGFGFTPSATSTSAATTGSSGFGAAPAFGSSFSGFNTQSKSSGLQTGFSFGGFGSQPSDATATQPTFASFGSPSAAPQSSSPLGGSIFGGASGQSTGFNTAPSPFGGAPTQAATSPSFTAYRK